MHNEILFFSYVLVMIGGIVAALRYGKEALIALVVLQSLCANLFVTKQILLFGLTVTASDALAVGIALTLNLLQEFFGRPLALKAIWISFGAGLFYILLSLLHLGYLPDATDWADPHFKALLLPMPRILFASLLTYLLVQQFDCRFYGFLKEKWQRSSLVTRNLVAVSLSQLLDTVLFSFLGLYGNVTSIASIIVLSFLIKLCSLFLAAPFMRLMKHAV